MSIAANEDEDKKWDPVPEPIASDTVVTRTLSTADAERIVSEAEHLAELRKLDATVAFAAKSLALAILDKIREAVERGDTIDAAALRSWVSAAEAADRLGDKAIAR